MLRLDRETLLAYAEIARVPPFNYFPLAVIGKANKPIARGLAPVDAHRQSDAIEWQSQGVAPMTIGPSVGKS